MVTTVSSPTMGPARRHLVWFLVCRILVIFLLLAGTFLYYRRVWLDNSDATLYWLSGFFVVAFTQTLFSLAMLPRIGRLGLYIRGQICWDLLLVTGLIYLTGGVESPFAFLLLFVIISSSFFLPRREVFSFASAAVILYGSLLDLQYYHYLPRLEGLPWPATVDSRSILYTLYVNVTAVLLIAFLSGMLAERLRRSELARERTEIDFQELESLHLAIQSHISSGLMIVNPQGRIRVFNREAERITGYRLTEIYDRCPEDFFPIFAGRGHASSESVERAEGVLLTRDGSERVVGYNISLVFNPEGLLLGQLINFQDLTRFKALEEQIKRADRLAAVGRLASGLAHEIRNPLASISGSVQLLLEQEYLASEDRRLMGIVVREADRLNALLGEFLAFARPAVPKRVVVQIAPLVEELLRMTEADRRFADVRFECRGLDGVRLNVDPQQLRQVLWNLLVNAADAMSQGGIVVLATNGTGSGIIVEDSGPGIPESERGRIFDPFFTTKERGTGLGLATVHAIVVAHGGMIRVEKGSLGGACFVMDFPGGARHDAAVASQERG